MTRPSLSRRGWHGVSWLLVLAAMPLAAARAEGPAAGDTSLWRDGIALIGNLWTDARARVSRDGPDWLHRKSNGESTPAVGATYLALQESRPDGTDLLTLRYVLDASGSFRTYAGAGLSHAQYYFDNSDTGQELLSRQQRRMDLGPAAEVGAELNLSEHVRINADLRWADLDARASVLRGDRGPVAADPVAVGVSVGYRFR
jgi:opacity protein-like surface antigen